jgi:hypothetical protein
MAPISGLSTVHHHSEKGVRSSRESMGGRFRTEVSPLVAEVGLRGVKETGMFRDRGSPHLKCSSCPAKAGHPVFQSRRDS